MIFQQINSSNVQFDSYVTISLGIILGKDHIVTICDQPSNFLEKLINKNINITMKSRFALAATGLLNGKNATTHNVALKMLQGNYPDIRVVSESKVIQDGNIITSGGVSSGINMALYLVENIIGKSAADRTAKAIEFDL